MAKQLLSTGKEGNSAAGGVTRRRQPFVTRMRVSYHGGAHSSGTCCWAVCPCSTRMASASSPAGLVSAARCTPRSISSCLFSERILQSFLLNPPQSRFHTLKGCRGLFMCWWQNCLQPFSSRLRIQVKGKTTVRSVLHYLTDLVSSISCSWVLAFNPG